ncbi:MAG: hypothetical protein KF718_10315 [Polyangiaceae bacterium]|nr:hypothetical protein [Polyangiaceae bacterium]
MADEKKPKIDLKARLGKKTVTAPAGASIPPPVGLPKPSGVPAPPFGSAAPERPKIDASNPYSAISADQAPVRAEPAAIKIEMSEEVVQAQKKGRAKVVVLAFVACVVGGVVGYAVGGGVERGKGATAALSGAQELVKEVDTANTQIEELADALKSAREKLSSSKYPTEEVSKLGGINIPFSGATLAGKGIGRFNPQIVTMLINFAAGSEEANDQKDKIRSILTSAKPAIEDFLAQKEKPKVRWSVFVENGPHGPWVSMQPLPAPFDAKDFSEKKEGDKDKKPYKWPDDFEIKQGDRTFKLKRYTSGDPTRNRENPDLMPVNPDTQAAVCPTDVIVRLTRELSDLERTLRGDKTPGNEKDGLIDTGRTLNERLKMIGSP